MHAKLLSAAFTALAVVALTGTPAEAQRRDVWAAAYDAGYRDGARAGGDDARSSRAFEFQRHRDYRAANRGYDSRIGPRAAYADQYRGGFVAGYRDGYYAGGGRGAGGRGREPWFGARAPGRPGLGRPGGFPGVSDDIGYSNGFEEGYKRGVDDGRDRDRYDPRGSSRYRDADRGYRRDYGPKAVYEASYRRGFERGYDQGYQDGQRRRGGWRW